MTSIIHAPEYVAIVRRLLPVIRQQKAYCVMPFNEVCDRLAFYWNRGTFTFSIDDFGVPHGACLIRLFSRGEEFLDPLVHKPCGKFCMIDLLVADTPNVAAHLCEELVERWGRQSVVMWDRDERTENGSPRIYLWKEFQKIVRRLTYGMLAEA
jgi:hypothetical protein